MASEDDWPVRRHFFGNGDQSGHLRIVDDYHICATLRRRKKRSTGARPVSPCILLDPLLQQLLVLRCQALIGMRDTLEDVVVCLRNPKDAWPWLRDVPI